MSKDEQADLAEVQKRTAEGRRFLHKVLQKGEPTKVPAPNRTHGMGWIQAAPRQDVKPQKGGNIGLVPAK